MVRRLVEALRRPEKRVKRSLMIWRSSEASCGSGGGEVCKGQIRRAKRRFGRHTFVSMAKSLVSMLSRI